MKRTTRTDATTSTRITNTNTTRSVVNYNVYRLHQDVYMLDLPTITTTIMVVESTLLLGDVTPGPRLVGLEVISTVPNINRKCNNTTTGFLYTVKTDML